jgi:hypothetical protein
LSAANLLAYEHYRTCRAVGAFPDDPIVRQNALLIRDVEDSLEREDWLDFRLTMQNIARR